MKKIIAIVLTVMLIGCLAPMAAMATQQEVPTVEVTVSIINETPMVAAEKITVTDADNNGVISISDALYCAHEAKYEGGAEAGYATEMTQWGISPTKLWGVSNGGSYGYFVNHVSPSSLADEIKSGDIITAFVYTDTTYFSDKYSYYDQATMTVDKGAEITLTLSYIEYDIVTFEPVTKIAEGVTVTVNGNEIEKQTNIEGKVTLRFTEAGTYLVSAVSNMNLVSPVCVVTVNSPQGGDTPPPEEPTEPANYGWLVPICAAVVVGVLALAMAASKKNEKKIAEGSVSDSDDKSEDKGEDENENKKD